MSEEEKKKIIEMQKMIIEQEPKGTQRSFIDNGLLQIIEEQQKEIEELKERNKELVEAIEEWVNGERINDIKHISKDKIKEKIKELEDDKYKHLLARENIIKTLKELLEE